MDDGARKQMEAEHAWMQMGAEHICQFDFKRPCRSLTAPQRQVVSLAGWVTTTVQKNGRDVFKINLGRPMGDFEPSLLEIVKEHGALVMPGRGRECSAWYYTTTPPLKQISPEATLNGKEIALLLALGYFQRDGKNTWAASPMTLRRSKKEDVYMLILSREKNALVAFLLTLSNSLTTYAAKTLDHCLHGEIPEGLVHRAKEFNPYDRFFVIGAEAGETDLWAEAGVKVHREHAEECPAEFAPVIKFMSSNNKTTGTAAGAPPWLRDDRRNTVALGAGRSWEAQSAKLSKTTCHDLDLWTEDGSRLECSVVLPTMGVSGAHWRDTGKKNLDALPSLLRFGLERTRRLDIKDDYLPSQTRTNVWSRTLLVDLWESYDLHSISPKTAKELDLGAFWCFDHVTVRSFLHHVATALPNVVKEKVGHEKGSTGGGPSAAAAAAADKVMATSEGEDDQDGSIIGTEPEIGEEEHADETGDGLLAFHFDVLNCPLYNVSFGVAFCDALTRRRTVVILYYRNFVTKHASRLAEQAICALTSAGLDEWKAREAIGAMDPGLLRLASPQVTDMQVAEN